MPAPLDPASCPPPLPPPPGFRRIDRRLQQQLEQEYPPLAMAQRAEQAQALLLTRPVGGAQGAGVQGRKARGPLMRTLRGVLRMSTLGLWR